MYFLLSVGIELFSILVLFLPVFLLLHFTCFHSRKRTCLCFALSVYFAGIYFVTGLPTILFHTFEPGFYLLPFIGIADDIRNSILNIILFLPLGFLIPVFCEKFRNFRTTLMLGFSCSLFIELAQVFTYRLSDINDLITNTQGAVLGYLLAKKVLGKGTPAPLLCNRDLYLTAALTALIMFFLQPLLVSWIWYFIP